MNKKRTVTIAVLITIALLMASPIGNSHAASASDAYIRVAVLNSDVDPPYQTGINNNFQEEAKDLLNTDPYITATNISNIDVETGALDNYDVLFLPDNWPNLTANQKIIDFWNKTSGGGIVALDSSIAFLCYAGILPAEANGTNGRNVYWDYNTVLTAQITAAHPITAGYTIGQNLTASIGGDARYNITKMSNTTAYPYFKMLANAPGNMNFSYVSAYDSPDKGRVVHIWEQQPDNPEVKFLILNAVRWAARAPSLTELVDSLQSQITTLQTQITTLQGQLTTAQTTITTLTANITSLKNQIADLQAQLDTVNQTHITTTDNLNTNLNNTTLMSYAGIAVGAVGVIVGLVAIALSRRKPTK